MFPPQRCAAPPRGRRCGPAEPDPHGPDPHGPDLGDPDLGDPFLQWRF